MVPVILAALQKNRCNQHIYWCYREYPKVCVNLQTDVR